MSALLTGLYVAVIVNYIIYVWTKIVQHLPSTCITQIREAKQNNNNNRKKFVIIIVVKKIICLKICNINYPRLPIILRI